MTDQLRDDELYALVRRALPQIDVETLSASGAQARAVLDRVIAGDRVVPGLHSFFSDDNEAYPPLQPGRRRRLIVASIGIAAVAATLLVVSLTSLPSIAPKPTSAASHRVVAVRARLLAALDAAGNDVVVAQVVGQEEPPGSGVTTCPATSWFFPADAQPGGEFRERFEGYCPKAGGSSVYESAVSITVKTVTPYVLQSPQVNVGISVCGTGSFAGYNTTSRKPTGTTWQASDETLRVPAPATPALLRSEVNAGSLRLVGDTTIDGAPAIELSVLVAPTIQIGYDISEKLWVDPSTYLPIRRVTSFKMKPATLSNEPPGAIPTTGGEVVQNFNFLPPTSANLALLKITIPRGLTPVPAGAAQTTRSCSAPFAGGPGQNG